MIEGAAPKLTDLMKLVAAGVINNMQLPEVYIGTVATKDPLSIRLSANHILPAKYLILTNAVKDHKVDIEISWTTEGEQEHIHGNGNNGANTLPSEKPHKHTVKGRKEITVYNGLTDGEKVLLLRIQGGQNYVVVDRISELKTRGENV